MKKHIVLLIFFVTSNLLGQESNDFSPCNDSNNNVSYYPYYSPKMPYNPDFYKIKKYFETNYFSEKYKNIPNNTGMIHISFIVNCNGETGGYFVETFDYNYKYCIIDEALKNTFLKLTKELKVWKLIVEKDKIQNFHKFFIFKITNGKLVEIMPK